MKGEQLHVIQKSEVKIVSYGIHVYFMQHYIANDFPDSP